MMENILVSVVCPTYKQARYIRQGLDSILMQKTTFPIEILIGEDCSPDDTNDILKEYEEKYPGKFQIFHREVNLKQSKNIYDLFVRSKGKYVITLDLDDFWLDEYKLQKQVDFLENHPEYVGVSHDFEVVDKEGNIIQHQENRRIKEYLNRELTLKDFLTYGFVFQTGTFLYQNYWNQGQDFSIIYQADDTVVDLTINSILLQKANIFILPEAMSAYRMVLDPSESNACSERLKNIPLRDYETLKQFERLDKYFEGQVDYSIRRESVLNSYFKGWLKRTDSRYSLVRFLDVYFHCDKKTKHLFKKNIRDSITRKIRHRV